MCFKITVRYANRLDGFYWWMMAFYPHPILFRQRISFSFRYTGWSLTLWCYGWRCKDQREREFSPATGSAATEKWWSYGVLLWAGHWLLSSRGEWTPARCTAPRGNFRRLLGRPACMVVYIRILCDFRWKVIVSAVNCVRSDKTLILMLLSKWQSPSRNRTIDNVVFASIVKPEEVISLPCTVCEIVRSCVICYKFMRELKVLLQQCVKCLVSEVVAVAENWTDLLEDRKLIWRSLQSQDIWNWLLRKWSAWSLMNQLRISTKWRNNLLQGKRTLHYVHHSLYCDNSCDFVEKKYISWRKSLISWVCKTCSFVVSK